MRSLDIKHAALVKGVECTHVRIGIRHTEGNGCENSRGYYLRVMPVQKYNEGESFATKFRAYAGTDLLLLASEKYDDRRAERLWVGVQKQVPAIYAWFCHDFDPIYFIAAKQAILANTALHRLTDFKNIFV